jgi:hypothetical protein
MESHVQVEAVDSEDKGGPWEMGMMAWRGERKMDI